MGLPIVVASCCLLTGCALVGYERSPAGEDAAVLDHASGPANEGGAREQALDAGGNPVETSTPMPSHVGADASSPTEGPNTGLDAEMPRFVSGDPIPDAGMDAAVDERDASADSTVPAAADAGADAGSMACGGTPVFGLCWYLGAEGQSCDQACAARGGFDWDALAHVGIPNQGGSAAECGTILTALGYATAPTTSTRVDRKGLGCHVWSRTTVWWIETDAFDPSESVPLASIACACNE
ncbi:MAG: hypothetical protein OXU20_02100 [Myxococcales bacterium]|nr:hypothetical protein [Myxococcales bacterium]